jgi:deazaflavin-dependent oxidoreductase (nitroreductase family)
MRKMFVLVLGIAGMFALLVAWMRCTRIGAGFANDVANPYLVARGVSGSGASEIGTLEHIGRRSGTRRLTPLHAIPTDDGFKFAVPLGERSEWARNVVAAGRARMQLHDEIHELVDPALLAPSQVPGMPVPLVWLTEVFGWRYLVVRSAGAEPGSLQPARL